MINAGINDSAKSLQGNGIGVEYAAAMSPIIASIYNNTVVSAEKYGILNQNSSGFTRNNLIISSGLGVTSGSATASNNPTSASFVDLPGGDYHLDDASAASGTVGVDIAATDFDGDTRTTATADCGAYEYP